MKKKIWLYLGIFIVIVAAFLSYQWYHKTEFISYLQSIDTCFQSLQTLQKLSIEANRAGMAGDQAKEIEINAEMVARSEEFLAPFKEIQPRLRGLRKIHAQLLELNDSTHELLVFRVQALNEIKDTTVSNDEKKVKIDEFWKMQEQNRDLYRKLSEDLHKYAKRTGVDVKTYLKNFVI